MKIFFFCFTLVPINMPSQKRKKRRNRNCCKKEVKIVCQLKLFSREMNQLLVLIRLPTHLSTKLFTGFTWSYPTEETSNYDNHDNVPNENNWERIKNSKYPNASFKGIPEKNQPKYIDFPKITFEKSSWCILVKNGTRNSLSCIII